MLNHLVVVITFATVALAVASANAHAPDCASTIYTSPGKVVGDPWGNVVEPSRCVLECGLDHVFQVLIGHWDGDSCPLFVRP